MRSVLIVVFGWMFATMAMAEPQEDAAAALNQKLTSIQSLRADFEQLVMNEKGSVLQEVSGTMTVKRPRKFTWVTKPPYPQTVVSNGELVWIYDEDLEQVTVQNLDQRTGNTPALLLSGDPSTIATSFTVKRQPLNDDGRVRFRLKPQSKEALFEELSVVFDQKRLISMDLLDSLGQKTAIDFKNVETNAALDDDGFQFDIPEGVDVIKDI